LQYCTVFPIARWLLCSMAGLEHRLGEPALLWCCVRPHGSIPQLPESSQHDHLLLPVNLATRDRIEDFRMLTQSRIVMVCIVVACAGARAHSQDTNSPWPDSPSHTRQVESEEADRSPTQDVSWRRLPKDFLRDQKAIWLFPAQLAKGHHWLPVLVVVGGTAGLIVADPHAMPYFRSHSSNLDDVNDTFDGPITTAEVIALPASLMIAGYARHDSYQVGTALLAGEAYADSAVVDLAIKAATRRKRPSDVAPGAEFNDTFFAGGISPFKGSSFPSGHAAGAFAVATVVATRYHNHRWVPWAVYGFAMAVSLSRVTTLAHFPSDTLLGAVLGYTITRYQVLRTH
jgi:membrane-associated phospholipid phosphatase